MGKNNQPQLVSLPDICTINSIWYGFFIILPTLANLHHSSRHDLHPISPPKRPSWPFHEKVKPSLANAFGRRGEEMQLKGDKKNHSTPDGNIEKPLVNVGSKGCLKGWKPKKNKRTVGFFFGSVSIWFILFEWGKASKFQPQCHKSPPIGPWRFLKTLRTTNFSGRQTWELFLTSNSLKSHQLGASNNQSLKNWTQVEHGWSINTKLTNQNS